MLLVERWGSTPPGWVHSKTIQLSQQINHVERTQWSWTRALFFFLILFYFFLVFQSCDRSLVGSVAAGGKKCARLQAPEILFFFLAFSIFLEVPSVAFGFGSFVVVIWEVFRMSLIWRLHDCIKKMLAGRAEDVLSLDELPPMHLQISSISFLLTLYRRPRGSLNGALPGFTFSRHVADFLACHKNKKFQSQSQSQSRS